MRGWPRLRGRGSRGLAALLGAAALCGAPACQSTEGVLLDTHERRCDHGLLITWPPPAQVIADCRALGGECLYHDLRAMCIGARCHDDVVQRIGLDVFDHPVLVDVEDCAALGTVCVEEDDEPRCEGTPCTDSRGRVVEYASMECPSSEHCEVVDGEPACVCDGELERIGEACWERVAATLAPVETEVTTSPVGDGEWVRVEGLRWAELRAVGGSAADDVWIAGNVWIADERRRDGVVLRWDGSGWARSTLADAPVAALWAASPDDVWLASGGVCRWDGDAFLRLASGGRVGANAILGWSADDVWALGAGTARHWDGERWDEHPVTLGFGQFEGRFISGAVSNDVFFTGDVRGECGFSCSSWCNAQTFRLAHWDGRALTPAFDEESRGSADWSHLFCDWDPECPDFHPYLWSGTPRAHLTGLWASSADHLWISAGWGSTECYCETEGGAYLHGGGAYLLDGEALRHWDGERWSDAVPEGPGPGRFEAVWAASDEDVWFVGTEIPGEGRPQWLVAHWDGRVWHEERLPAYPDDESPRAVWGSSATDVWVVGDGGTILHWPGAP